MITLRLRRLLTSAALLGAAALVSTVLPALPAQAATPAVLITKIYYDSPGKDTRSASSLNAEYVTLKNTTKKTINLSGYTLRDAANHIYTFSGTVNLGAGRSVTIHTGKGKNTAADRYWNSGNYIWNNDKDSARLRDRSGKQIDSCAWTKPGKGYTTC